jgi:hypothetical protein
MRSSSVAAHGALLQVQGMQLGVVRADGQTDRQQ